MKKNLNSSKTLYNAVYCRFINVNVHNVLVLYLLYISCACVQLKWLDEERALRFCERVYVIICDLFTSNYFLAITLVLTWSLNVINTLLYLSLLRQTMVSMKNLTNFFFIFAFFVVSFGSFYLINIVCVFPRNMLLIYNR